MKNEKLFASFSQEFFIVWSHKFPGESTHCGKEVFLWTNFKGDSGVNEHFALAKLIIFFRFGSSTAMMIQLWSLLYVLVLSWFRVFQLFILRQAVLDRLSLLCRNCAKRRAFSSSYFGSPLRKGLFQDSLFIIDFVFLRGFDLRHYVPFPFLVLI
jgi:hypothetical protein